MITPKGRQGSWFARWQGKDYPCVHERWTRGTWPEYADPGVDDRPEWLPFVEALRKGEALLTKSVIPDGDGPWRRSGYTGLYEIQDVRVQDGTLRFTFAKRVHSF